MRVFVTGSRGYIGVHLVDLLKQAGHDVTGCDLDLFEGRAFVSLVAFDMCNMRLVRGGRFGRLMAGPLATHAFLNVRTYVRHANEPGIYFLAEWLPNRLACLLGPPTYGLPYRLGRLTYRNDSKRRRMSL